MRWLRRLFPLALAVLLIFVLVEPLIPEAIAEPEGKIRFMPNVIPELRIHFVEEFFRFQWVGNTFDLKLLVAYEDKLLSLRDFWEKDKQAIKWRELVNKATESMYEFGYVIEDIPQIIADKVDYLVWKVEGTSFSPSQIELEVIEDPELDYNITRFHLPDNLVLSYEDLWLYDFSVSHPDKTTAKIENVKGKTEWNLDPIAFSSNIMTMTEEGSSGSWTDDLFELFWNASVTNNWNVSEKTDWGEDTQYTFGCRLQIGNGTEAGECYVYDTDAQVCFNSSAVSANDEELITVTNSSHMRLGVLHDATDKTTSQGVKIITHDTYRNVRTVEGEDGSEVLLYSCAFRNTYAVRRKQLRSDVSTTSNFQVYNCELDNTALLGNAEVYNIDITYVEGFAIQQFTGTLDRGFVMQSQDWVIYVLEDNPFSVENIIIRNIKEELVYCHRISTDKFLIDVDSDEWSFNWVQSSTAAILRQYTFNLTVTYPNGTAINGTSTGARVTIQHYGQTQTTDYNATLGADGTIPQQTITMGFYNQTGGDTLYSYNPYNLRIWNLTGYQDINMNFTLSETTKWTQTLQPTTEGGIATGFIFGGILAFLIMTVLGLAYIGKK